MLSLNRWRVQRLLVGVPLVLLVALLQGCATSYLLENQVQTFSSVPTLPANPSYRFERLPSQLSPLQDQLEALADPALFNAGLRRDDAQPRYAVQVSARVQRSISPWAEPWDRWGLNVGLGWGRGSFGFAGPVGRWEQPWFQREVAVVIRDLGTSKVVFESQAVSESTLMDNTAVLPAMLQAAMQGFPNPPVGVRRVDISISASAPR